MNVSNTALVTIAGMAIVTYATRVGGLWALKRIAITPRLEAWLKVLPGTILVSIIAPAVLASGVAEALAGLATALVAWRSKNVVFAMIVGVASVFFFRSALSSL